MAKARPKKRGATRAGKAGPMPKKIFAIASPRSVGGVSMLEGGARINSETIGNFANDPAVVNAAVSNLQAAGFDVLQVTDWMINIAGSQATFEKAFNTRLITDERPVVKEQGRKDTATFIDCPDTDLPGLVSTVGTAFDNTLEGIAIEEPCYFHAASKFPPRKSYWYLDVPAGVSLGANADKAHRAGLTGKGIRIAMVDTGQYKHPFFAARGYRVAPVVLGPGATNPDHDEYGHGTGESANIFAVAPDIQLLPVKAAIGLSLVNATGAFNTAVALNPDIITCSWGRSILNGPLSAAMQARAAAVATAWAQGIVVVFSAGNGPFGYGFPGQHPDVISAGGVFLAKDGTLNASNYSAGFMSRIYPNRRVPDLSGLVGENPMGIYIMLPVEPGNHLDTTKAGGTHPDGDETGNRDGWAGFSGTSAAAPQLAGAAALVLQACPKLTPGQVRDVLMKSARDVTKGRNAMGDLARVGPDVATGNGLVDVHKATLVAKIRCLGPIIARRGEPRRGEIEPRHGIEPVRGPRGISDPIRGRRGGIEPREPIRSIRDTRFPEPRRNIRPYGEGHSDLDAASLDQESYLSQEEVEALEDMTLDSDLEE